MTYSLLCHAGSGSPAKISSGATASAHAPSATVRHLWRPLLRDLWYVHSASLRDSLSILCTIGASPGFKGQELAVVGGGDTALEEALYLTKYGKHVHLLVRSKMRASKTMQDRVLSNDKISVRHLVSFDSVLMALTVLRPWSASARAADAESWHVFCQYHSSSARAICCCRCT